MVMKLAEIYRLAVQLGKDSDIRGNYLDHLLNENHKHFEQLTEAEQYFYDRQALENPFNDTRVLVGTGEEEISSILCGIDMETQELLLADRLSQKGYKIDLVLAHHPEGIAEAELHEVMQMQADMLEQMGVPINVGEGLMASRINEVHRGRMPLNHQRAVDAARLLNIPFMCAHTAADNLANRYMQNLLEPAKIVTVGDIMDLLMEIPEYIEARRLQAGPTIIMGNNRRRAGKIFVKFSGGTATADKAYEKLAQAGVGTIIGMHMSEKHRIAARDNNLNVIIAGHMASDSLGMNLLLDELEQRGVDVIPCSGLIRVKRFAGSEIH
jgi:putative NIF3 family GTP cyclohydrolase 1 type 2